jgi:predicted P-loop ATPase/GTPase
MTIGGSTLTLANEARTIVNDVEINLSAQGEQVVVELVSTIARGTFGSFNQAPTTLTPDVTIFFFSRFLVP